MTRFMISLDQAVELVWHASEDMVGGEIYVKKIPSIKVIDVAKAISPRAKLKTIGTRKVVNIIPQSTSHLQSFISENYERCRLRFVCK